MGAVGPGAAPTSLYSVPSSGAAGLTEAAVSYWKRPFIYSFIHSINSARAPAMYQALLATGDVSVKKADKVLAQTTKPIKNI